jgi:F-type H+-transporting ATPase subunit delta
MKYGSIAKRYATALVRVAQEKGKVEEVYEELSLLQKQFSENPKLRLVMGSPVVKPSKKKVLFQALLPKFSLSPMIGNLVNLLIDQERIPLLPILVLLYRDMADELLGRVRVNVTAAASLGASEAKLKSILEKSLRKQVLLEVKVDPEILGGLVVQVNDRVFDASLKRDLQRIQEAIGQQAVA